MATPNIFERDVLFYQRLLKSMRFYDADLDGVWGAKTKEADTKFVAESAEIANELGRFDSRTEGHIATLHIKAQRAARLFMRQVDQANLRHEVRFIQSSRTYLEQDALFRKGRTEPGPKVTNAQGGQSNHNFSIAWDIGIFDGQNYINGDTDAELKLYKKVAEVVDKGSLEWGGNWQSFKDFPHYQLKTGRSASETRKLFEKGLQYV